mmetsp:Transcript_11218/g.29584  ORF Transcript_11218/g.29584 Transcript_11218/m.29584 type:complete len:212 (+) Transcript_11218:584-1219(+)
MPFLLATFAASLFSPSVTTRRKIRARTSRLEVAAVVVVVVVGFGRSFRAGCAIPIMDGMAAARAKSRAVKKAHLIQTLTAIPTHMALRSTLITRLLVAPLIPIPLAVTPILILLAATLSTLPSAGLGLTLAKAHPQRLGTAEARRRKMRRRRKHQVLKGHLERTRRRVHMSLTAAAETWVASTISTGMAATGTPRVMTCLALCTRPGLSLT